MIAAKEQTVPVNIRQQYWWLYIPFVSWLLLVFPLILPPIPIGPIVVSFSWNRREWMSFLRRGMAHAGRARKKHEFPMRWLVNVAVNLGDLFTLGLDHLFITAELLGAMIQKHGSDAELAEINPVLWVLKWLFLGNVVFLALYVICPGLIFEHLLTRLEKHLYWQYQPVRGTVTSVTSAQKKLTYDSVMTGEELVALSSRRPVLLFADNVNVEAEPGEAVVFAKALANLAADLVDRGVTVWWCNLNQSSPSRYWKLANDLTAMNLARRGWTLFVSGKAVAHRDAVLPTTATTPEAQAESLAGLARETLGLPHAAMLPRDRVGVCDRRVRTLEEAVNLSRRCPVILITYHSDGAGEDKSVLEIRNALLPTIRPAVEAHRAVVCLANTDKKNGAPIRDQLSCVGRNFKGAMFFRNGVPEANKSFGVFSTWADYAKHIHAWLGGEAPRSTQAVQANYYVVNSLQEAQALSSRGVTLLVADEFSTAEAGVQEFVSNILPDIWPSAQQAGTMLCLCNTKTPALRSAFQAGGLPLSGVAVFRGGRIIGHKETIPGPGSAVRYVDTARAFLQEIQRLSAAPPAAPQAAAPQAAAIA